MKSEEKRKEGQSFEDSGFFNPDSEVMMNSNLLEPNQERKENTEKDIENLGALVTSLFSF